MKRVDELGITKFPWTTCSSNEKRVKGLLFNGVADFDYENAEDVANARLAAAAPELYECLLEAVENMEEVECDPDGCAACLNYVDCVIPKFRAALAKAGGVEVCK